VDVSKPAAPAPVQPTAPQKSFLHWQLEQALHGTFSNISGAYELMKQQKYDFYFGDKYSYVEELTQLLNRWGINCVDAAQICNTCLVALNSEGKRYDARFVLVGCKPSGIEHVFMQVRGEELGSNFVDVDFAEAASGKGNIGSTMCSNGYTVKQYNPGFALVDDGAES
jgi:hypothetical protein